MSVRRPLAASLFVVLGVAVSSARPAEPPRSDHYGDPLPSHAVARLGTVRLRHPLLVGMLVFSPDDRTLFSTGQPSPGVRQWDLATGKELRHLKAPKLNATAAAVSVQAGLVAWSCGRGEGVCLQDLATGKELRQLRFEGYTSAVAFSPDGKLLAAGGADTAVKLWDVATGKKLPPCKGHTANVARVAFSPDGKRLVSSSQDRSMRLWDVRTATELRRLEMPSLFASALVFSPDGKLLASAHQEEKAVRLWDLATGKELRRLVGPGQGQLVNPGEEVMAVQFSPDGKRLASADGNRGVRLWDVSTGKALRELQVVPRGNRCLAFSHDGKLLAAGGVDGVIRLWDPATGRRVGPADEDQSWVMGVAFSPDGSLVATGSRDNRLRFWRATTGELLRRGEGHEGYIGHICFTPDGRTVASAGWDPMVRLWDVTAGKERRRLEVDKRAVLSLVLSPDGRVLASGGYNDPTIRLWDVAGGKELRRLNAKGAALAVAFSADGRVLVSTNDAGEQGVTVHRWEVATGKELRQWPNSLRGRSLSADGRLLATSDYRDPAIRLWDTATGREYRKFVSPEGKGSAAAVAFSHDGRTVACGIGIEGVIHLWEVATGAECSRLQGHQTFIRDLAFSPDGRKLVSGSSDTTALLWDLTGLNGADRARLKLSAEVLDRLWTDLAGDDGVRAYQAIWRLATDPQAAVPYVRQRLQPASPADPQRLARLITDLDSKRFTVRQRAVEELEKLDDLAEPALRRALEGKPSLEFRRQAEEILRRLAGPVNDPAKRRALRAIEMLEYAGTPEARALLTDLAKGTPDLRLTREAKAALERLARRR